MSQMTSTARAGARPLYRPTTQTPRLRVVTGAPLRHGSAAFGVVCAVLLAVGLIGVLVLNTALAQGTFTLSRLQATSDRLADTQGALSQSLDASRSPASLASKARDMGMVPAESVAFLRLSDDQVIGVAKAASAVPTFNVVVGTPSPSPTPAVAKPAITAPAPAPVVAKPVTTPPAAAPVVVKPAITAAAPGAARPAQAAPPLPATKPAKPAKR